MATKDTFSSSKNKQQQFVKNSTNNDQHFNLNLNESFKCPEVALIQSQSNSYGKKAFDKDDSAIFDKEKSIIRGWNKSTDSTAFNSDNQKEVKKARKSKSSSNDTNNSTLSLHIAAFENSYEDAASDDFGSKIPEPPNNNQPTLKQLFTASSFISKEVFEIPRQQNDKINEPEISQYRSTQQLKNPNKAKKTKASSRPKQVGEKKKRGRPKKEKEKLYNDNEDFGDNDDDDDMSASSASSAASSDASESEASSTTQRRSTRKRHPPPALADYVPINKQVRFDLQETPEEREEIERAVSEQNANYNWDGDMLADDDEDEVLVVASSSGEEDEESAKKKPKKAKKQSALAARRDALNPPDLYFIGKCSECVFYAPYLDVTSGNVMKFATVSLPIFGPSRVIYDSIKEEKVAEDEAKKYARGRGFPFGKVSGRFIAFISTAPERIIEGNEDRIFGLEEENREMRIKMNAMESKQHILEKTLGDIISGKIPIPQQNSEAPGEPHALPEQSAPPQQIRETPQLPSLQQSIVPLVDIQDAPSWNFVSEAGAREQYRRHPERKAFVRSLFKNMFTDYHSFQLALPSDRKEEFQKICWCMINPRTAVDVKQIEDLLEEEFKHQHKQVHSKITQPKCAAVAMIHKAVPLIMRDNAWIPSIDVPFARMEEQNVRQWPILLVDGERSDTMFAQRKNPESERSLWNYFIITKDGVLIHCSKD